MPLLTDFFFFFFTFKAVWRKQQCFDCLFVFSWIFQKWYIFSNLIFLWIFSGEVLQIKQKNHPCSMPWFSFLIQCVMRVWWVGWQNTMDGVRKRKVALFFTWVKINISARQRYNIQTQDTQAPRSTINLVENIKQSNMDNFNNLVLQFYTVCPKSFCF